jgi:alpha-ketoglutarate-dependent taurine dioxygenase
VGVGGSKEFLDFHVDFFRFPSQFFPQIFAFMGIRGDPAKVGRTLFVDFRELYSKLDPAERRVLREEKVTWDIEPKPFSGYVIEGKAAYRRVKQLAMELSCPEGVWLAAGDVCILHQRKVAHARSCYEPKFDGNDRWMQRVAITTRNIWDDGSPVPFPVRRIPLLT